MIDLSIVIVNYNVRYFIAQCIQSILQSDLNELSLEVIVVDNNSQDDSFPYLIEKFGQDVTFLRNDTNHGFAKACNQGFEEANGKVILFLNPDTIVQKSTLYKAYKKLIDDSKIGALGVKLVDGSGKFLSESKRSLPTPANSFMKLAGIKIESIHKVFPPYNLDHLDEDQSHYVDVLCGAFIMAKREVLLRVGGFDEAFFMYGEDIDLCKRIKKEGYKLLYYPEVAIVHFKGESHKEKDINYYKSFFNAMSIYASKHYGLLTASLLRIGILIAATLSLIKSIVKRCLHHIVDLILIFSIFSLVKSIWSDLYFNDPSYYPHSIKVFIAIYSLIVFTALILSKYYSNKSSLRNIIIGLGTGLILLLIFHGIMPEDYRYSRMIIVLSVSLLLPFLLVGRLLVNYLLSKKWILFNNAQCKVIAVGTYDGFNKIKDFISNSFPHFEVLGRIYTDDPVNIKGEEYLGHIDQLNDLIAILSPDEVIFNLDDIDIDSLFVCLNKYGRLTEFKGYSEKFNAIIGNAYATKSADVYTPKFYYKITDPTSRVLKWSFDKLISLLILILFPMFLALNRSLILDAWKVLVGNYTWVSYCENDNRIQDLPQLKPGIYSFGKETDNQDHIHISNLQYARNYSLILDIEVFFKYLYPTNN